METITSVKHPAIQSARGLSHPEARRKRGEYLIEGAVFCRAALESKTRVKALFLSERISADAARDLSEKAEARSVPTYPVAHGLLFKIIGTSYETAITAVAVVEQNRLALEELTPSAHPWIVLGENVQDPRNLGMLIRTVDAAGVGAMVLGEESADAYSRACVRSTTGSILEMGVLRADEVVACARTLKGRGYLLLGSSAAGEKNVYEFRVPGDVPVVLALGNETTGMTSALRELCAHTLRIPLAGRAHSLNIAVAAGVLLFQLREGFLNNEQNPG